MNAFVMLSKIDFTKVDNRLITLAVAGGLVVGIGDFINKKYFSETPKITERSKKRSQS